MKIFSYSVVLVLAAALSACGADVDGPDANDTSAENEVSYPEASPATSGGDCCFVACYDGTKNVYGPFTDVKWGDCTEWGTHYCTTRGYKLQDASWHSCH